MMIEAIKKRKSIRKFQDRKVEPEKIEEMLRAAMQAPSGMKALPWEFIVVDDPQIIEKLKNFSMGAHAAATAPLLIIPVIRNMKVRTVMKVHFMDYEDLAAATENLWLQAVEEGLSVSWMGVPPDSKSEQTIIDALGIPKGMKPFAVLAAGYADEGEDLNQEDRYDISRVHYNKF